MWKPASVAPTLTYFLRMQIRRPLAATLLFAVMISGCASPPVARPSASPVPTTTPVFASEAEALEAAREAYAAYETMSDEILRGGGERPERIAAVATGEAYTDALSGYENFRTSGYRLIGTPTARVTSVQTYSSTSVTAYVCLDVSGTDVVDRAGESIVSPDRPLRQPFVVTFEASEADSNSILLASRSVWEGNGICD